MILKRKFAVVLRAVLASIVLLLTGESDLVALTTEERIENLELLLSRVKLEQVDGKMSYIFGPESCELPDGTTVTPCGVNIYVRNGSGVTSPTYNGLGNIIVGYNQPPATATPQQHATHSLIVGEEHDYNISTSALFGYQHRIGGGIGVLVAGRGHLSPENVTVATNILGGIENTASLSTDGIIVGSTIVGGAQNITMDDTCTVS